MNFNFIVPQSPAGVVPALYCVSPHVIKPQNTPLPFLHPKFKTEVCNKYDPIAGCPYGEQCQFRHPEDPSPMQIVMKKMSQITITESSVVNGVGKNGVNGMAPQQPFGMGMNAAGRCAGRYVGRTFPNQEFRRRNMSYNSQYNNKIHHKKFFASEDSGDMLKTNNLQNREFLGKHNAQLAFLHPKFKTELCNKYDPIAGCPYGEQCQFRHPEDSSPMQIVMKKMSQITITENSVVNGGGKNSVNGMAPQQPFGMGMNAAGRCAGRYIGRTFPNQEFRRRNMSYNSQYNNKIHHKKFFVSEGSGDVLKANNAQNRDFLNSDSLPQFLKFAGKAPKNGMRRYNSQETIGYFTYSRVTALKKRLSPLSYLAYRDGASQKPQVRLR